MIIMDLFISLLLIFLEEDPLGFKTAVYRCFNAFKRTAFLEGFCFSESFLGEQFDKHKNFYGKMCCILPVVGKLTLACAEASMALAIIYSLFDTWLQLNWNSVGFIYDVKLLWPLYAFAYVTLLAPRGYDYYSSLRLLLVIFLSIPYNTDKMYLVETYYILSNFLIPLPLLILCMVKGRTDDLILMFTLRLHFLMTALLWVPYLFSLNLGNNKLPVGAEVKTWLTILLMLSIIFYEKGQYLKNMCISSILVLMVWINLDKANNSFEFFVFLILVFQHILSYLAGGSAEVFVFILKCLFNLFFPVEFCCIYDGKIKRVQQAFLLSQGNFEIGLNSNCIAMRNELFTSTPIRGDSWRVVLRTGEVFELCHDDYSKLIYAVENKVHFVTVSDAFFVTKKLNLLHCHSLASVLKLGISSFGYGSLIKDSYVGSWEIRYNGYLSDKDKILTLLQYRHFKALYSCLTEVMRSECLLLKKCVGNKNYKRFCSDYTNLGLGKMKLCERNLGESEAMSWVKSQSVEHLKKGGKIALFLNGEFLCSEKPLIRLEKPCTRQSSIFRHIKGSEPAVTLESVEKVGEERQEVSEAEHKEILKNFPSFDKVFPRKYPVQVNVPLNVAKSPFEGHLYKLMTVPSTYKNYKLTFTKNYIKKLVEKYNRGWKRFKRSEDSKACYESSLVQRVMVYPKEVKSRKRCRRRDLEGLFSSPIKKRKVVTTKSILFDINSKCEDIGEVFLPALKNVPNELKISYLESVKRYMNCAIVAKGAEGISELLKTAQDFNKATTKDVIKKRGKVNFVKNDLAKLIEQGVSIKKRIEVQNESINTQNPTLSKVEAMMEELNNEENSCSKGKKKKPISADLQGEEKIKLSNRFEVLMLMEEDKSLKSFCEKNEQKILLDNRIQVKATFVNSSGAIVNNSSSESKSRNKGVKREPLGEYSEEGKQKVGKKSKGGAIAINTCDLSIYSVLIKSRKNLSYRLDNGEVIKSKRASKNLISRSHWDKLKKACRSNFDKIFRNAEKGQNKTGYNSKRLKEIKEAVNDAISRTVGSLSGRKIQFSAYEIQQLDKVNDEMRKLNYILRDLNEIYGSI